MNNRRRLLVALVATALIPRLPLAQSRQPILIGWLMVESREFTGPRLAAFKEGLAALGWKDGSQIVIEERWATGQYDRLRPLAEELAAKKPAIIVAAPSQSVAAAANAAPATPIVQANGSDPVFAGFAASLSRPGGMITGLSNVVADVNVKHLELLLSAAPKLRRVGFLTDATTFAYAALVDTARRSVAQRQVEARFADAAKQEEIEPALSWLAKEGVQALIITASPLLTNERRRIVNLALKHRWPVIAGNPDFAGEGALLSYGADRLANFRRAAYYVDRILKGAKPADLPIEQPTRFELIVNMKTAKALGLKIPQSILVQATKVIE